MPAPVGRPATAPNLASAVEQVERDMIQAALDRAGGNISETARVLGLTRRGLYLKMRRLGLDAPAGSGHPLTGAQWILTTQFPRCWIPSISH